MMCAHLFQMKALNGTLDRKFRFWLEKISHAALAYYSMHKNYATFYM
jgi:hypothetical protein